VSAIDLPQARRLAFGLVLGQAGVTVIATFIAWMLGGEHAALSALIGGGIATVASLAMAGLVFGGRTAGSAQRALQAFYVGEAVKVALVIALFVLVLKWVSVQPLALLTSFIATVLVYWIALIAALPNIGSEHRGA
jgi:ATP synthase protein I